MTDEKRVGMVGLPIPDHSPLPVMYRYDPGARRFETVGGLRIDGDIRTNPVTRDGPDTPAERDAFLASVLTLFGFSDGDARRIVANAQHLM